MLLTPTKEQLNIIKEKGKGGNRNDLRTRLAKKRVRISDKLLKRYLIDLTPTQEEYIQGCRLLKTIKIKLLEG